MRQVDGNAVLWTSVAVSQQPATYSVALHVVTHPEESLGVVPVSSEVTEEACRAQRMQKKKEQDQCDNFLHCRSHN